MSPDAGALLQFLGTFALPERRPEAAAELARILGIEEVLVFTPDPEIDVLLPAPGLPQTLRDGAGWRAFLTECRKSGEHAGRLHGSGGRLTKARGFSADQGVVVVLVGEGAENADIRELKVAAPVLGVLIRSERRAQALVVRSQSADEAVAKAQELSDALRTSHSKLQAAYAEVARARQEAEALSEELHAQTEELEEQASELEEQTAELEAINDQFALSEARLRSVIDSSLDAIITIDPDSIITDWNRPAADIFGWSTEEAVGRSLPDMIIPEQHREAHLAGMSRFLATGEGAILNRRIEITALYRNGREFPVELAVSPSGRGKTLLFSAFIRDITDRKAAERRREVEQQAIRILSESHTIDGAAVPLLNSIGTSFGWKVGALWIRDEGATSLRCAATWQDSAPGPLRFVSATQETTFGTGEGLPGRVWETLQPQWISDVTTDSGFPRARSASLDGLHSAFAFPIVAGEELVGVAEFFGPAIAPPDPALLETFGAVGLNLGQSILRIRAEERRNHLLSEVEGLNTRLQRMNLDLLAQTKEAERMKLNADRANRAKSEFLATMSHELRTPINAIIGYSQLLEDEIAGPITEAQRTNLVRIAASSQHLLVLINDVLDLARIEAGRMEVAVVVGAIGEVVEGALALVRPQAAKAEVNLVNATPDSAEPYLGDPDRARQILINLLTNAVKFTPAGGTVSVRVCTTGRSDARVAESGPWTCVEVEDSGIGIAANDLERIFTPFEQAESGATRTRSGAGLGLTISQRLARLMKGRLTAWSEEGKGSRFTMCLRRPSGEEASVRTTTTTAANRDRDR